MKRGTPDHPKTRALARLLQLPSYAATGLLEHLWQWTARYSPDGGIGRWADAEIADGIGWEKDAGDLVRALLEARLVDDSASCRLVVHDWPEHAEDSVHRALAREARYFADGSRPKVTRLTEKERAEIEARYAAAAPPTPAHVRQDAPDVRPNAHTGRPAVAVAVTNGLPTPLPPPAPRAGEQSTDGCLGPAADGTAPPAVLTERQARVAADQIASHAAMLGVAVLSDRDVRELRRLLRRGQTTEAAEMARLEAAAAQARAQREEDEAYVAAASYAASRGGWPVLARGAIDWLERNRGPDEAEDDALERWAAGGEEQVPRGVLEQLATRIELVRRERAATAGAGGEGGRSAA